MMTPRESRGGGGRIKRYRAGIAYRVGLLFFAGLYARQSAQAL